MLRLIYARVCYPDFALRYAFGSRCVVDCYVALRLLFYVCYVCYRIAVDYARCVTFDFVYPVCYTHTAYRSRTGSYTLVGYWFTLRVTFTVLILRYVYRTHGLPTRCCYVYVVADLRLLFWLVRWLVTAPFRLFTTFVYTLFTVARTFRFGLRSAPPRLRLVV